MKNSSDNITPDMLQSVWKSVQLLQLLLRKTFVVSVLIPVILLFFSAVAQAVTVAVVQQALQNPIQQILLKPAVQRFRRVMLPKKESFKDFSEIKKQQE